MTFYSVVVALLFILKLCKTLASFLNYLHTRYDQQGVKLYRKLEDAKKKLSKTSLDIVFLQNCKAQNVIPKFLRFKLYKRCLHNSSFYVSWQHKLLINELKSKRRTLEHLKLKIVQLLQEVNNTFSNFDCIYLHRVLDDSETRFTNKTRSTHSKKLKHLGIDTNLDPVESVIFNYSSIT